MTDFEAMRRLALTLGVSAPESNEDIFNASFINTLTRAVKRSHAGVDNLHRELEEKTKVFDSAMTSMSECANRVEIILEAVENKVWSK